MAVPKFITNDMKGGYVGGPTTPARRCYVGGTLVYQGFGPAAEQEFIRQEAAGGPAQLLKVYGKTIVNNQLVQNGDFSNGTTGWNIVGFNLNAANGILTLENTGNAPGYASFFQAVRTFATHKYLCAVDIYSDKSGSVGFGIFGDSPDVPIIGGQWQRLERIASYNTEQSVWQFTINRVGALLPTAGDIMRIRAPRLIDLTLRFGAGNEPTLVDEALRLLGGDAFDPTYDVGSLQSNKTAELRAYDGGTLRGSLALNIPTLTSGGVAVFPYGMRGVGTDRDAAYGSTGVVRRAVVDLGTLNWSYQAASSTYPHGFFSTLLANYAKTNDTFLLTAKYSFVRAGWAVDKTIRGGDKGSSKVYIIDSAYTDAATFKAAMSGVMLDYPLATPLTYTLDTPLPTDLTCEQGDKLQRVSDNNCPFVGEMRFGL